MIEVDSLRKTYGDVLAVEGFSTAEGECSDSSGLTARERQPL